MANQTDLKLRFLFWGPCLVALFVCFCLVGICTGSAMGDESRPTPASQQSHPADQHSRISETASRSATPTYVYRSWFWTAIAALIAVCSVSILMARALMRIKKAEAALKKSESLFKQIAGNIREVFWVGTPDFRRLDYISPAYETIWGRSCESLYKDPLSLMEGLFPHDREAVMDFIGKDKTTLFDGATFPEFRIVRPDGAIRWIHARTFTIKDANSSDDLIVGIGQDTTRRKFFEASFRESEEKWRSLMENSPDHIMLMDLDGHILFANRSFMGIEKPDLIVKTLVSLISPEFEPVVRACMEGVVARGKSDACQVENNGANGKSLYFELRMGPVTVNDQTVAVAVNSTEITDRVYQEKVLLESEAFHRTFFNDAPTGIAIQDFSPIEASVQALKGAGVKDLQSYLMSHPDEVSRLGKQVTLVKVNQALVDLYKAPSERAMLGSLCKVFKGNDRQHFIDQVVAFTGGQDRYQGEARNVDFRGNTLHLIIRKAVIQREVNGLSKILTSLVDVTPTKAAEKERELLMLQLQQAQKMEAIGTLAGGVAHDFNNILSIILGNAELSLADIPQENPARLNIQEIRSASLRAKDIVRQLLGFSRKTEQILKPIHLIPVVEEAVKFLRATIPANIGIYPALSVDDDVIRADATQIHQIMINLFTNASHAMEETGGSLTVRADNVELNHSLAGPIHSVPSGRYVRMTVADTGTGIPDEVKRRIFDPYFTTKEVGKGTGMGLSMVHGIMKNSGGGIVLNTKPGEGTTFELYFPLVNLSAQAASSREEDIPTGTERILFVDDEEMIVELYGKILDRLGYRVSTCTDPSQALSLLDADSTAFDMVITDMTMPGMTGDQLVQGIREIHPTLPVVLCTGYSKRLSKEKAKALAISAVLDKPVVLKKLAIAIRQVLDHARGDS
ncbi:MAG: PAS domain S-box protein [Desulfosarcina sp.]|nr:PAS domain S-box protein [Desulfosarcina sp.]